MHTRSLELGSRALSFETGKLAKQADGSVLVRMGDTVVLVTACHAATPRQGIDFLPLTVDYREFTYASGRIPGGFFKREGKPTEKEVLTSRLIDRPIRPLFPAGWAFETQIIAMVVSADTDYDSDVLAVTGAGCALALSEMPFRKTIAGVRVGYVDGAYVINPTFAQRKTSKLDLIIAGSADAIMMVEAGAQEVTEEQMVGALDAGHTAIKQIVATIDDLAAAAGKKKLVMPAKASNHAFYREVEEKVYVPLSDAMRIRNKLESYGRVDQVLEDLVASIPEGEIERKLEAKKIFKGLKEKVLRDEILERGHRLDGRKFDEIRAIWSEVTTLPRVHGSAVFTRGETQALVTATLGTADDQQKIETMDGESYKRFMLHYNFPPFSVGETGFMRGPGRREVGHGALAERALTPVMPTEDQFPYTIRVVSDILESNGSSSMASVCGGAMAMMDAGVPLSAAGRGRGHGPHPRRGHGQVTPCSPTSPAPKITTATWTSRWPARATASPRCRWTSRSSGITMEIMRTRARAGARGSAATSSARWPRRLPHRAPRPRTYAPRIVTIHIPVDKIRDVIGPGGKMIRSIIDRTGVKIDVEDDGRINVASNDEASSARALAIIQELTATPEIGKTLHGQGAADRRLRRVRRDHARRGRSPARLGDRAAPRQGRPGRAQGRRTAPRQGAQRRSVGQGPPQPQGASPGGAAQGVATRSRIRA